MRISTILTLLLFYAASLTSIDSYAESKYTIFPDTIGAEGGEVMVYISLNSDRQGLGFNYNDPMPWIEWTGWEDGDPKIVTLTAARNFGGPRTAEITFFDFDETVKIPIPQKGCIDHTTIANFLTGEGSDELYRLQGIITNVVNSTYGSISIQDYSGEVYISDIGSEGEFEASGLKLGDIVTLVGSRTSNNGIYQMSEAVLESRIPVVDVSMDEFLSVEAGTGVYYRVNSIVESIASTNGRLYLSAGDSNRLFVSYCYPGWGATGNDALGCISQHDIMLGDQLTIIGQKSHGMSGDVIVGGVFSSLEKNRDLSTCAEVCAGKDNAFYHVRGVCMNIENIEWGNWYLTDETGSVYIYGTLDAQYNDRKFSSLGIEEGDIVTVVGCKFTYAGQAELCNVFVTSIEKGGSGIENVVNDAVLGKSYDLMGRPSKDKGLLIRNGRVFLMK